MNSTNDVHCLWSTDPLHTARTPIADSRIPWKERHSRPTARTSQIAPRVTRAPECDQITLPLTVRSMSLSS